MITEEPEITQPRFRPPPLKVPTKSEEVAPQPIFAPVQAIGGKMIGAGAAGCIYFPALSCDIPAKWNQKYPKDVYAMKVQGKQDAVISHKHAQVILARLHTAPLDVQRLFVPIEADLCLRVNPEQYNEFPCRQYPASEVTGQYVKYVKGERFDKFEKKQLRFPDDGKKWRVIRSIIIGVKWLHLLSIYHKDLYGRNVLIDTENWEARILDFDSAEVGSLTTSNPHLEKNDLEMMKRMIDHLFEDATVEEERWRAIFPHRAEPLSTLLTRLPVT